MLNHLAFASAGAHELEQMQLILETVPVIREEDKDELLKVMPSFVSSTWEVKRPLRKLLPEVNSEGTPDCPAGVWRLHSAPWLHPGARGQAVFSKRTRVPRHRSGGPPLAAGLCPRCFQTEFSRQATLKAVTAGPPHSTLILFPFPSFSLASIPLLHLPLLFPLWKAWYSFISFQV